MDALPCRAAVEVQPVLADPASSVPDDSDDQLDYAHADGKSITAGWIGCLRNAEYCESMQAAGHRVQLNSYALSVRGRFCRCQITAAIAQVATPTAERCSLAGTDTGSTPDSQVAMLSAVEAAALADCALMLVTRHLSASSLNSSATACLKAYYVGRTGATMSGAIAQAWRQQTDQHGELFSLPALAVGMTSALDAFLLLECTCTALAATCT